MCIRGAARLLPGGYQTEYGITDRTSLTHDDKRAIHVLAGMVACGEANPDDAALALKAVTTHKMAFDKSWSGGFGNYTRHLSDDTVREGWKKILESRFACRLTDEVRGYKPITGEYKPTISLPLRTLLPPRPRRELPDNYWDYLVWLVSEVSLHRVSIQGATEAFLRALKTSAPAYALHPGGIPHATSALRMWDAILEDPRVRVEMESHRYLDKFKRFMGHPAPTMDVNFEGEHDPFEIVPVLVMDVREKRIDLKQAREILVGESEWAKEEYKKAFDRRPELWKRRQGNRDEFTTKFVHEWCQIVSPATDYTRYMGVLAPWCNPWAVFRGFSQWHFGNFNPQIDMDARLAAALSLMVSAKTTTQVTTPKTLSQFDALAIWNQRTTDDGAPKAIQIAQSLDVKNYDMNADVVATWHLLSAGVPDSHVFIQGIRHYFNPRVLADGFRIHALESNDPSEVNKNWLSFAKTIGIPDAETNLPYTIPAPRVALPGDTCVHFANLIRTRKRTVSEAVRLWNSGRSHKMDTLDQADVVVGTEENLAEAWVRFAACSDCSPKDILRDIGARLPDDVVITALERLFHTRGFITSEHARYLAESATRITIGESYQSTIYWFDKYKNSGLISYPPKSKVGPGYVVAWCRLAVVEGNGLHLDVLAQWAEPEAIKQGVAEFLNQMLSEPQRARYKHRVSGLLGQMPHGMMGPKSGVSEAGKVIATETPMVKTSMATEKVIEKQAPVALRGTCEAGLAHRVMIGKMEPEVAALLWNEMRIHGGDSAIADTHVTPGMFNKREMRSLLRWWLAISSCLNDSLSFNQWLHEWIPADILAEELPKLFHSELYLTDKGNEKMTGYVEELMATTKVPLDGNIEFDQMQFAAKMAVLRTDSVSTREVAYVHHVQKDAEDKAHGITFPLLWLRMRLASNGSVPALSLREMTDRHAMIMAWAKFYHSIVTKDMNLVLPRNHAIRFIPRDPRDIQASEQESKEFEQHLEDYHETVAALVLRIHRGDGTLASAVQTWKSEIWQGTTRLKIPAGITAKDDAVFNEALANTWSNFSSRLAGCGQDVVTCLASRWISNPVLASYHNKYTGGAFGRTPFVSPSEMSSTVAAALAMMVSENPEMAFSAAWMWVHISHSDILRNMRHFPVKQALTAKDVRAWLAVETKIRGLTDVGKKTADGWAYDFRKNLSEWAPQEAIKQAMEPEGQIARLLKQAIAAPVTAISQGLRPEVSMGNAVQVQPTEKSPATAELSRASLNAGALVSLVVSKPDVWNFPKAVNFWLDNHIRDGFALAMDLETAANTERDAGFVAEWYYLGDRILDEVHARGGTVHGRTAEDIIAEFYAPMTDWVEPSAIMGGMAAWMASMGNIRNKGKKPKEQLKKETIETLIEAKLGDSVSPAVLTYEKDGPDSQAFSLVAAVTMGSISIGTAMDMWVRRKIHPIPAYGYLLNEEMWRHIFTMASLTGSSEEMGEMLTTLAPGVYETHNIMGGLRKFLNDPSARSRRMTPEILDAFCFLMEPDRKAMMDYLQDPQWIESAPAPYEGSYYADPKAFKSVWPAWDEFFKALRHPSVITQDSEDAPEGAREMTKKDLALYTLREDAKEIALRAGVKRLRSAAATRLGAWWATQANKRRQGESETDHLLRVAASMGETRTFLNSDMGEAALTMLMGMMWTTVEAGVENKDVRNFGGLVAQEFRVSAGVDLLDGVIDEVIGPVLANITSQMPKEIEATGVRVTAPQGATGEDPTTAEALNIPALGETAKA